ncbi:hypothetical protein [Deinococcus sp.]|uniref:hypothetical protein n=1 Tax=Deinococcus sp. TaxID=47478 RepID=UPI003B5B9A0D
MNKLNFALAALLSSTPAAHAAAEGVAPIVVKLAGREGGELLGAWDGQRWVSLPAAVPLVKADTPYRLQSLSGDSSSAVGSSPVSFEVPCPDAFSVDFKPNPPSKQSLIATRPDLRTRPRPVTLLPTNNPAYQAIMRTELRKRGLSVPALKLQRLVRVDLDGDGRSEVILEASLFSNSPGLFPAPNAAAGDYSLLLLRSVISGKVQTTVLGEDVMLKAGNPDTPRLNTQFRLEGVADLNGDGQMELLTSDSYYEGESLYVWTWTPGRGLKKVLETGCGV